VLTQTTYAHNERSHSHSANVAVYTRSRHTQTHIQTYLRLSYPRQELDDVLRVLRRRLCSVFRAARRKSGKEARRTQSEHRIHMPHTHRWRAIVIVDNVLVQCLRDLIKHTHAHAPPNTPHLCHSYSAAREVGVVVQRVADHHALGLVAVPVLQTNHVAYSVV
jgi:hypothetical protein